MTATANHSQIDNSQAPEARGECLLKLKEVMRRTGLGHTTIYRRIGEGSFPKAKALGKGTVRWRESDINTWIRALPDNDNTTC